MQTNKIVKVSTPCPRQYLEQEKSPIDPDRPLPFEDFYLSLVRDSSQRLQLLLSDRQSNLLSRVAYKILERDLLERMVALGTKTLAFEFDRYRESHSTLDKTAILASQDRAIYDRFIADLRSAEIDLFTKYPVLDLLLTKTRNLWIDSTHEFIDRLDADISLLSQTFANGSNLGQLQEIETALGDRHHHGRSVFALKFESGIEVIYKPKNLGLDVAFNELSIWCNRQNISLPFRTLKILDREASALPNRQEYGWQEVIKQQPCTDRSAVQNFYYRSGMMLSLLYVLGAKDCAHQNVIACGEYPLLIDADSLLCPVLKGENDPDRWFDDSVLRSGFLPRWNGDDFAANALDSSVLGNIFPKQTNATREWQFINTEGMQLVPKTTIIPAGKNAVVLDGKTISPQSYLAETIGGFEEISELFIDCRDTLLSEKSPLQAFANCKSRIQIRPAITYGAIVNRTLDPQSLQADSEDRILINRLLRHRVPSTIETSDPAGLDRIFQAEARALQQLDIPCFSVCCNGTDLRIDRSETIPHFFSTSSYQHAIEKIRNFDAKNLALQVKLIRSSFAAKYAHLVRNDAALQGELPSGLASQRLKSPLVMQSLPTQTKTVGDLLLTNELTNAQLQQEAIAIGRDLVAAAVWDGDGCNWIEFSYMFRANRYRLALLDDSLYTGRAGVSLFLAALAKITGDVQFRQVALSGLDPFCRSIRAGETRSEVLESKFGLLGLGGTIYSLVKVSEFLKTPALLEDAVRAAKLLTPHDIERDRQFDIMWGSAGAILGLLALYQATGDRSVLDTAISCGDRLLASRTENTPRAWITSSESPKPLTGFSHGAAGISLALLRLYVATKNNEYLAAAQAGIAYECSVFDSTVQNWPDFRSVDPKDEVRYLDAWCHGSAGIGLARLASCLVYPTDDICQEIDAALSTSQNNGIFSRGVDHLCCGNIGRIELLVVASQVLDDLQVLATARENTVKMVIASRENGAYGLLSREIDRVFCPSFYRGIAGIGYQLLRTIDPASIPSVAIWE
jgi:type 2 lantibiotic biosynthesis protein LanM